MAGRGAGAPDAVLEKLAKVSICVPDSISVFGGSILLSVRFVQVVALIQSSERAEQEAGLRVCINLVKSCCCFCFADW